MPNRSQAWAAALLVAVFLAGGAAGYWFRDYSYGERPEPRMRDTGAMVTYLTHQLGLDAAEQESVRVVLRRHRAEVEAAWRDVHPRFDSLRAVMEAEISARLRPTQQQRYRDLVTRLARQREHGDSTTADRH